MIDKSSSYIKAGLRIRVELTGSESGFDPPPKKNTCDPRKPPGSGFATLLNTNIRDYTRKKEKEKCLI